MSFSVVLSSMNNAIAPFTFNGTTYAYSFDVDLRSMIPPELLNSKYSMRFALVSRGNVNINEDTGSYHVAINLPGSVSSTQLNGERTPHFGLLYSELVNTLYAFHTRPADNGPLIIQSLKEVYKIEITIYKSLTALGVLSGFNCVLYFDPVV